MTSQRALIGTQAAEAAAAWRAKLDGDDAAETDWLEYEAWLGASPEHVAAAAAIDAGLADSEIHHKTLAVRADPQTNVIPFTRRWKSRAVAGVAAAAAAALIAVWAWPAPTQRFAYMAPLTSDQEVALPDGSTLHLNRGAAVRVAYGRERRVDLERGEVAFKVRHDPTHPFAVAVGQTEIRDIGTEFNIARNPSSVVVTVRSGEVELAPPASTSTHVRAGFGARISAQGVTVAPVQADDAFAWQTGQLVYRGAPLSIVVEDLNRYSPIPIVLDPSVARDLHFSGSLTIDQPDAMLARLQSFLPIRSSRDGNRIVVRSAS